MAKDKQEINYVALVEALIFSSKNKIKKETLLKITGLNVGQLEQIVEYLKIQYQKENSGVALKSYDEHYVFQTKEIYSDYIEELFDITKVASLSTAAMETLAIVAYRQPVTRTEIEEIRGVRVAQTLNTLAKYELIEELGRKETVGNPIIYGTTNQFLEYLDINNLAQLPEIERVEKLFANEIEEAEKKAKEESKETAANETEKQ